MRQKIIIGNWKMHKTIKEANQFLLDFDDFSKSCKAKGVELGIAPSFLCLESLTRKSRFTLIASQNVNAVDSGAFTGEISIPMLQEIGVKYSLVGHSERRTYYAETSETCNAKNLALFAHNMYPIYCVGETLEQYEKGKSKEVVKEQLVKGLKGVKADDINHLIVAYEPIWSIGTGKNASVEIAEDICHFIRTTIAGLYNETCANKVRIQYGGSVKPENAKAYLSCEDIDGVLVGGASLETVTFKALVNTIL
ncbi:MAG: triose-phosphate isomerase [Bacilli bacterium]|nr:triose-phosphate isomerase [Bacilli bacterium]MDD4066237.1 triose-phosphate isomerase [Bacilli bacterium]